ncbi:hypothetical protein DEGR_28050 [Deinococcus grandis]|nr:hypothetical protein DEGR_28050 [Deinococcus grandis]
MTAPEPAPVLPPDLAPPAPEPARDTGPVRDRALLPDVLRGVALLGILIVNMQDFAGFLEWQQVGVDRAAQVVTDVFANGRFISIFAMLFGWGAAGILARRGAGVFLRRHAALLVVGALHYALVWHGDIISNYTTLALALLLVARLSARALLGTAGALGAWWLGLALLEAAATASRTGPRFAFLPDLLPTYAANVQERAAEFWPLLLQGNLFNGPWLVALFCLGAAAGKAGLLTRPEEHRPLLRRLAVGAGRGVAAGALLAYLNTRADYAAGTLALPVRMAGAGGRAGVRGRAGAAGRVGSAGRVAFLRGERADGHDELPHAERDHDADLLPVRTASGVRLGVGRPGGRGGRGVPVQRRVRGVGRGADAGAGAARGAGAAAAERVVARAFRAGAGGVAGAPGGVRACGPAESWA